MTTMKMPVEKLTQKQAVCVMSHIREMLNELIDMEQQNNAVSCAVKEKKSEEKKENWISVVDFCLIYPQFDSKFLNDHLRKYAHNNCKDKSVFCKKVGYHWYLEHNKFLEYWKQYASKRKSLNARYIY